MPMKEVNNKVQRLCQEVLQLYEAIICKQTSQLDFRIVSTSFKEPKINMPKKFDGTKLRF